VTEDYSACIQDLKDQFAHSGRRMRRPYRKLKRYIGDEEGT
jgi:hypothetical protein